jgi:hypothetical protein
LGARHGGGSVALRGPLPASEGDREAGAPAPAYRNPVSSTVGRATMVLLPWLIEQLQLKAAVAAGSSTRKREGAQMQATVVDTPPKWVPTTSKGVRARWRAPPPRRRPLPCRPQHSRATLEAGGSGRASGEKVDDRPFQVQEGREHHCPRSSSEHGGRRRPMCRPPAAGREPRGAARATGPSGRFPAGAWTRPLKML